MRRWKGERKKEEEEGKGEMRGKGKRKKKKEIKAIFVWKFNKKCLSDYIWGKYVVTLSDGYKAHCLMLSVIVPQAEESISVLGHFSEPTRHAPVEQGA